MSRRGPLLTVIPPFAGLRLGAAAADAAVAGAGVTRSAGAYDDRALARDAWCRTGSTTAPTVATTHQSPYSRSWCPRRRPRWPAAPPTTCSRGRFVRAYVMAEAMRGRRLVATGRLRKELALLRHLWHMLRSKAGARTRSTIPPREATSSNQSKSSYLVLWRPSTTPTPTRLSAGGDLESDDEAVAAHDAAQNHPVRLPVSFVFPSVRHRRDDPRRSSPTRCGKRWPRSLPSRSRRRMMIILLLLRT